MDKQNVNSTFQPAYLSRKKEKKTHKKDRTSGKYPWSKAKDQDFQNSKTKRHTSLDFDLDYFDRQADLTSKTENTRKEKIKPAEEPIDKYTQPASDDSRMQPAILSNKSKESKNPSKLKPAWSTEKPNQPTNYQVPYLKTKTKSQKDQNDWTRFNTLNNLEQIDPKEPSELGEEDYQPSLYEKNPLSKITTSPSPTIQEDEGVNLRQITKRLIKSEDELLLFDTREGR